MSKTTNANLSVYPIEGFSDGLTKRELFAAMAMQGYLSIPQAHLTYDPSYAVKRADELLNELNK